MEGDWMNALTSSMCGTDDALAQTFLHFDTSNNLPLLSLKNAVLVKPHCDNDSTACTTSYANKTKLMDFQPVVEASQTGETVEMGMQPLLSGAPGILATG
jgi:hypothetical protein